MAATGCSGWEVGRREVLPTVFTHSFPLYLHCIHTAAPVPLALCRPWRGRRPRRSSAGLWCIGARSASASA